jgi:hypothetical protein
MQNASLPSGRFALCATGLALCLIFANAQPARATAIASVEANTFLVFPLSYSIGGVVTGGPASPAAGIAVRSLSPRIFTNLVETGNSSSTVTAEIGAGPTPNSVSGTIGGIVTASPGGYANLIYTLMATVSIINETGFDIDALVMRTVFSAFNPGGPGIGAIVDDTGREFARFESSQSGPGVGDFRACDTRSGPGDSNQIFPQPDPANACGVFSPASIESEFVITDLAAGEEDIALYTLTFTLEAESIPEPSALAILAAGLIGLGVFASVRRRHRQARYAFWAPGLPCSTVKRAMRAVAE